MRPRLPIAGNEARRFPRFTLSFTVLLLGVSLAAGCCSPCYLAGRTLVGEPSRYSIRVDRKRSLALYRTWAEQEWKRVTGSCTVDCPLTADYQSGFVTGFVDFVYAGGSGEPSPIPPREYWKISQRSPQGKERVRQWFSGYRHGARLAQDGGYREAGTIQLSLAESVENCPCEPTSGETAAVTMPHEESLPTPKAENQPSRRPSPPLRPRSTISPNDTTPENPFREDEPSGANTNTSAAPRSQSPLLQGANETDPVEETPADLNLPTEPLELSPAKLESSAPLQQYVPDQATANRPGDAAVSGQSRPSSRNWDALALVAAGQADAADKLSPIDSVPRNRETTLVVHLRETTSATKQNQQTPCDPASDLNVAVLPESNRWKPVETAEEIRHPDGPAVNIRVSTTNQGVSCERK